MGKNNTKKKIFKIDRDKLIESVYHSTIYGNTARNFSNVLSSVADKIDENEKMIVRYSIQWNVMLMTISFIDELNKFFFGYKPLDRETEDRITSFKYIIDPILKQINEWVGLRKFRNNVLAHNFRIDSEDFKSVHLSNELGNYNIPESTIDLITLLKYIDSSTKILEEMFKAEYNEALLIIQSLDNTPKKLNQSAIEETEKVNSIFMEVNRRINEYNIRLKEGQL